MLTDYFKMKIKGRLEKNDLIQSKVPPADQTIKKLKQVLLINK